MDATGHDIVRSGEFVAGNFKSYIEEWRPNMPPRTGKIWWVPLHFDRMPGLTVSAIQLETQGSTAVYTFPDQAWSGAGGVIFYPSGIPLPEAGRWRLTATAGPDWGCFELNLNKRTQ